MSSAPSSSISLKFILLEEVNFQAVCFHSIATTLDSRNSTIVEAELGVRGNAGKTCDCRSLVNAPCCHCGANQVIYTPLDPS